MVTNPGALRRCPSLAAWLALGLSLAMPGLGARPAGAQVGDPVEDGAAAIGAPAPATGHTLAAPGLGRVIEERVMALPSLAATSADLIIVGTHGWVDLDLPLDEAVQVRAGQLHLSYSSGPALVPDRSRLLLELDGTALAELPVAARRGLTRADVELPVELIHPGINRLTISGWQEHRDGCARDNLAELWTRIDPINSYLRLEIERPDSPPVLADLESPHWPLRTPEVNVSVLTTAPIDADQMLRIGGLVAQGFALRYPDEAVIVRHQLLPEPPTFEAAALGLADVAADRQLALTPPSLPPGHHVLVGTREQLVAVLGPVRAAEIVGPYLGIHRLTEHPADAYLVVSGPDRRALEQAATAFANPAFPLPATPVVVIDDPIALAPARRPFLVPGETYALTELAAGATVMDDGLAQRTAFEFFLPSDFYVADNRKASLRLDYGYKPDLTPDSVLHVMINGHFAGLIPLDAADGELIEGREIRLPLRLFRPGRNLLAFQPAVIGADHAGCGVPAAGPSVAIFANSTLHVPDVARVVPQLDLRLFESLAYPYADPILEADASLMLAAADSNTISAGWTLLGRLAQSAGRPLTLLEVGLGRDPGTGHRILVGPITAFDGALLARTPLQRVPLRPGDPDARPERARPQPARVSVVTVDDAGGGPAADRSDWQQRLGLPPAPDVGALEHGAAVLDGVIRQAAASVRMALPDGWMWLANDRPPRFLHERGERFDGLIAAVPAPDAPRHTLTIVTAADPVVLQRAVADLVKPAIWHELSGDIAAWNVGVPGAQSGRVHAREALTEVPSDLSQQLLYLNSYLAENPLLWTGLVALGLVAMALVTRLALGRE